MKKATIVSIVLALMVVANAAVDRVPIMKRKGGRGKNPFKRVKRDPSECSIVTCLEENETCSFEDDTRICNDDMECINGKCGIFVVGGPCSYGSCDNGLKGDDDLYCNEEENKCYKRKSKGESCTSSNECGTNLFCFTGKSATTSVCTLYPTKVGDSCSSIASCPNDLVCNSESKCAEFPKKDEPCINGMCLDEFYCDREANMCISLPVGGEACRTSSPQCSSEFYCDSETQKCVALPGSGDECLNVYPYCADGLYCDYAESKCVNLPVAGENCTADSMRCANDHYCNEETKKCVKYPGFGEECYSYTCASGLRCAYDNIDDKRYCRYAEGKKDGYCSYDRPCNKGLVCDFKREKCVEGVCESDEDCPSGKGCVNFNCVDFMSVEDGGVCDDYSGFGAFVCMEGSGCIPSKESEAGYKCWKIVTSLENVIPCSREDDPNCPEDSYCDCNSINGTMQCVPYPANSKKAVEYYMKALEYSNLEAKEAIPYITAIYGMFFPHDDEDRCYSNSLPPLPPSGSSSSIKPLAFTLVLFFIGFVKAFF